jgi:hypothetical protein
MKILIYENNKVYNIVNRNLKYIQMEYVTIDYVKNVVLDKNTNTLLVLTDDTYYHLHNNILIPDLKIYNYESLLKIKEIKKLYFRNYYSYNFDEKLSNGPDCYPNLTGRLYTIKNNRFQFDFIDFVNNVYVKNKLNQFKLLKTRIDQYIYPNLDIYYDYNEKVVHFCVIFLNVITKFGCVPDSQKNIIISKVNPRINKYITKKYKTTC